MIGSDLAVRVTGTIGAVFGSPVVVSEEFPADNATLVVKQHVLSIPETM